MDYNDVPFRAHLNESTNPIIITDSSDNDAENKGSEKAESDLELSNSGTIAFDEIEEARSVPDVQVVQDPGKEDFRESEPMATSTQMDGEMFQRNNKKQEKRPVPTPPADDGAVPGPSASRDSDSGPSAQHHQMIQR